MTRHTSNTATADTTFSPLVGSTWMFRVLVAAIVSSTIMLTGWSAAQASAVNDILGAEQPQYHSVRQLERAAQDHAEEPQYHSARQLERAAQEADRDAGPTGPDDLTEQYIQWLEYNELRRFRNRAPESGHAALDAEIERLRVAIANGS